MFTAKGQQVRRSDSFSYASLAAATRRGRIGKVLAALIMGAAAAPRPSGSWRC
jgi:hypothetical protein